MKHIYTLLPAALLAGLILSAPATAQDTTPREYTDGVFVLNEGWYGTERATVNYLDKDGQWTYRVPLTLNGESATLGTTGCFATISDGKMYIVSKKMTLDETAGDPTLTVCDAKTMDVTSQIDHISVSGGTAAVADGRAFIAVPGSTTGYLSTTEGVFSFDLTSGSIGSRVKGTSPAELGLTADQTGAMAYGDGKVFALSQHKGILVIDPEENKLIATVNNEADGYAYGSIAEAKDGTFWLSVSDTKKQGSTLSHLVKFDPATLQTESIDLPTGIYAPANTWSAWTPDGFCASPVENVLYWNGGSSAWSSNQLIYRYDIAANTVSTFIDLTTETTGAYLYGACMRVSPYDGKFYLGTAIGSAWGNNFELRVYDKDGQMEHAYPMETNYWYPEIPVFALRSTTTAISRPTTDANAREVARYSADGKLLAAPAKGLNIVKMSDGTTRKVIIR